MHVLKFAFFPKYALQKCNNKVNKTYSRKKKKIITLVVISKYKIIRKDILE